MSKKCTSTTILDADTLRRVGGVLEGRRLVFPGNSQSPLSGRPLLAWDAATGTPTFKKRWSDAYVELWRKVMSRKWRVR